MQLNNNTKYDIINDAVVDQLSDMLSNLAKANGEPIEYQSFIDGKYTSNDIFGNIATNQNMDTALGVYSDLLRIIIPTKILKDKNIIPTDKDRIKFGGIMYLVRNPMYLDRSNFGTKNYHTSFLVIFDAVGTGVTFQPNQR